MHWWCCQARKHDTNAIAGNACVSRYVDLHACRLPLPSVQCADCLTTHGVHRMHAARQMQGRRRTMSAIMSGVITVELLIIPSIMGIPFIIFETIRLEPLSMVGSVSLL